MYMHRQNICINTFTTGVKNQNRTKCMLCKHSTTKSKLQTDIQTYTVSDTNSMTILLCSKEISEKISTLTLHLTWVNTLSLFLSR